MKAWLARHAQTLVGSLGRLAQQPLASVMTMSVVAVALALPLFLYVLLDNTQAATAQWSQAFDLSVYLHPAASTDRALAMARQLRARTDVAQVRVISPEEALEAFRTASGFGHALDALTDNPLPATLIVTPSLSASDPAGTEALKRSLESMKDVESVQLDTEWIRRLDALLGVLKRVVWLTASLLGAGIVIIVGNTIRLDILNRKAEIEVMKLVGGSDGFARRPFLYSGIWYGLGGGLGAIVMVAVAVALLVGPLEHFASLYGSTVRIHTLRAGVAAQVVAAAVLLAWLGSWVVATRHIRAVAPT